MGQLIFIDLTAGHSGICDNLLFALKLLIMVGKFMNFSPALS